jgi:hypothetical protein
MLGISHACLSTTAMLAHGVERPLTFRPPADSNTIAHGPPNPAKKSAMGDAQRRLALGAAKPTWLVG